MMKYMVYTCLILFVASIASCRDDAPKRPSIDLLRKKATQGVPHYQELLGDRYYFGEDVEENRSEAFKWYMLSAEQGYISAIVKVAWRYRTGDGVTKNMEEAINWYKVAARRNDHSAQLALAMIYEDGSGVEQDYVEACKWYFLSDRSATIDGSPASFNPDGLMTDGQIAEAFRRAREFAQEHGWELGSTVLLDHQE